jgi:alkylated DNA repair protein (DNA oxidative demethylase)
MHWNGFRVIAGALDEAAQTALMVELDAAASAAPYYRPMTPSGRAMSVEQTSLGVLGWVTDARGYRYAPRHPWTGRRWPAIPSSLLEIWRRYADWPAAPDSCLVNRYGAASRLGLHRDEDEADLRAPVVSVSLGDTAIFRIGGPVRGGPTRSLRLSSGDVCVLSGPARGAYHGVDRILFGSSRLIPGGGRISLTLRLAGAAPADRL